MLEYASSLGTTIKDAKSHVDSVRTAANKVNTVVNALRPEMDRVDMCFQAYTAEYGNGAVGSGYGKAYVGFTWDQALAGRFAIDERRWVAWNIIREYVSALRGTLVDTGWNCTNGAWRTADLDPVTQRNNVAMTLQAAMDAKATNVYATTTLAQDIAQQVEHMLGYVTSLRLTPAPMGIPPIIHSTLSTAICRQHQFNWYLWRYIEVTMRAGCVYIDEQELMVVKGKLPCGRPYNDNSGGTFMTESMEQTPINTAEKCSSCQYSREQIENFFCLTSPGPSGSRGDYFTDAGQNAQQKYRAGWVPKRSSQGYRWWDYCFSYIQFWDVASAPLLQRPLFDKMLKFWFTIPGLYSPYSHQSSTFLDRFFMVHPGGLSYMAKFHVLGYQPTRYKCQATLTSCLATPPTSSAAACASGDSFRLPRLRQVRNVAASELRAAKRPLRPTCSVSAPTFRPRSRRSPRSARRPSPRRSS